MCLPRLVVSLQLQDKQTTTPFYAGSNLWELERQANNHPLPFTLGEFANAMAK